MKNVVCTQCGKPFTVANKRSRLTVCTDCQLGRTPLPVATTPSAVPTEKPKRKCTWNSAMYSGVAAEITRKCHDCGRPTPDYRCEKCRNKWNLKNHVQPFSECCEGWEEVA